jgi:hypothetical protein
VPEDNWHTKLLALRLLGQFAERSQIPFSRTLYQVIPVVSNAMWDTRGEVKQVLPPPSTISTQDLLVSSERHFALTFKRFFFARGQRTQHSSR